MLRKIAVRVALVPFMVFAMSCQKKTKTDVPVVDPAGQTDAGPTVDSTPMSFDASGSDSGNIQGLSTVFFDYDKSTLSSSAKATLQANAEWMKQNPNVKIQIEGHCDSRGSIEYNIALGERRANAVRSYLTSLGIPNSRLAIISYGEEKPLVHGETEEAYSKNRRANFVPIQ